MSLNRDDSMLSGEEFKIRRFAIGLEQPQIMAELGVGRAIIDKWQSGTVLVPRRARELLENCEAEVQASVDDLVYRRVEELDPEPSETWPWGIKSWFQVVSRARYALKEAGVNATIGGKFVPPPPKPRKKKDPGSKKRARIWNTDDGLPPDAAR